MVDIAPLEMPESDCSQSDDGTSRGDARLLSALLRAIAHDGSAEGFRERVVWVDAHVRSASRASSMVMT